MLRRCCSRQSVLLCEATLVCAGQPAALLLPAAQQAHQAACRLLSALTYLPPLHALVGRFPEAQASPAARVGASPLPAGQDGEVADVDSCVALLTFMQLGLGLLLPLLWQAAAALRTSQQQRHRFTACTTAAPKP